jgi:A/G-specific adenine glycosylase
MMRMTASEFRKIIWDYYRKAGRHDLPWRNTRDPYRILVSEVMLQQTQVPRVLKKYEEFLTAFPTIDLLAKARTSDLLHVWQGLGYNRRALSLKRAAEMVVTEYAGNFPKTLDELLRLPGVGNATAGGILAYAFDIPTAFIETNIRSVYIHFFFAHKESVSDKEILTCISDTVDKNKPREWYYALMDYGVYLKQTLPNPSRRSKHHVKQSPFKGSNREIRSKILKLVLSGKHTKKEITAHIGKTNYDIEKNIRDLVQEGFILETKGRYFPA